MTPSRLIALVASFAIPGLALAADNQIFELRRYTLVNAAAEQKLDGYLERALIPALARQGLGPIGAFAEADKSEDGTTQVMLLVPGPDVESVTGAAAKLSADEQYQQAGRDYLDTPAEEPLVQRIRSELLLAFDCWPHAVVPRQKKDGRARLFELRIYESPTETLGELKVEMFNAGEVPIFLDSGIMPVFMGQARVNPAAGMSTSCPQLVRRGANAVEPERFSRVEKFAAALTNWDNWSTFRGLGSGLDLKLKDFSSPGMACPLLAGFRRPAMPMANSREIFRNTLHHWKFLVRYS